MNKIPVYQPSLTGNERKYVMDCLDTTWISSKGEYVKKFEEGISEYLGVKYAAATTNGTTALHLSLLSLGIGPGDEVLVPTFTYIASVNAIHYVGATPVFVDSLLETWQMSPNDLEKKITDKTKAIIVVHLYGHPCDMDSIMTIAKEHSLYVIEDCAESLGAKYKGQHTGTFGDVSSFSFFGNKTVTCGEGGIVASSNKEIIDKVFLLKNQGVSNNIQYWHEAIGYNYRMTNICAAIGLAQLEQIDIFLEKKREIAYKYECLLRDLPIIFHKESPNTIHSFWMCSILMPSPNLRKEICTYLENNGIETRPLFYPVHQMPMYRKFAKGEYTNALNIGLRGINLPSWPALDEEELQYISKVIHEFFVKKKIVN